VDIYERAGPHVHYGYGRLEPLLSARAQPNPVSRSTIGMADLGVAWCRAPPYAVHPHKQDRGTAARLSPICGPVRSFVREAAYRHQMTIHLDLNPLKLSAPILA